MLARRTTFKLITMAGALLALAACGKPVASPAAASASAAAAPASSAAAASVDQASGLPYAPVQGAQPDYREIKDWVLACDNTHVCFAKYVAADDGSGGGGYLSIAREAGPNGKLVVTLMAADDHGMPDPGVLRLDGAQIPPYPWLFDKNAQTVTLEGTTALQFVRAIKGGSSLAYSADKGAPSVSLSGMTAVLLAMDENQGRLGGQTALIRNGPAPGSDVPAATPVPVVYAAPAHDHLPNAKVFAAAVRKVQAAALAKNDCAPEQASQDEAHVLDAGHVLVILGCGEGAYQGWSLVFEAPKDAPAKAVQVFMPLEPKLNPKDSTDTDGAYTEASWDAKTATFSESAKGRGLADCGSSSSWTWDGSAFVLSNYNALARCGGGPLAGDWPTLYRAKVAKR